MMTSAQAALGQPTRRAPAHTRPRWTSIKLKLAGAAGGISFLILIIFILTHMGTYDVALTLTSPNLSSHQPDVQPTVVAANTTVNASAALVRVNQTDESQYLTSNQHDQWEASACSAASMTEVIDAYGDHYKIGTILSVESAIGAISETQGLLTADGIDQTAQRFGFTAQTLSNPTLQQILDIANSGKPVLINFPPQAGTIWASGHFLVVRGGQFSAIQLADSSTVNGGNGLTVVDQNYMQKFWRGFAKVLTPSSALPSGLSFDQPYVKYAWDAAISANIPPILYLRQINQESGFNPKALSPAGAIGIAQFMPSTAAGMANPLGGGQLDPWNPEEALTAAARYTAQKDQKWADYAKALAAYNAGDNRVENAIKQAAASGNPDTWRADLPQETQGYIRIILDQ